MLPFFSLHSDELFYSACARYHIWSRNTSQQQTFKDLFGGERGAASIDFPNGLNFFCKQLPGDAYTPEQIIEKHTLYPFFRPFLPKTRADKVIQMMINGSEGKKGVIHYVLGVVASTVKNPEFLRFCPRCINEDHERVGEAYWHRHHQVPGIFACIFHKCRLVDSAVRFSSDRSIQAFEDITRVLQKSEYSHENHDISNLEWEMTKSIYWILENGMLNFSEEELKKKYYSELAQKGFLTAGGNVKKHIVNHLHTHYGSELLERIGCSVIQTDHNWLSKMLRGSPAHPLRHVLLMNCLNVTPEKFFYNEDLYHPFGKGPWACLNPAANHYKEKVIVDCEITACFKTRKPVGTFKCSCGFIFARLGPDQDEADVYRIGRIKEFGSVWLEKLTKMKKEKTSNAKIATILNVDRRTVKKQFDKLNAISEDPFHDEIASESILKKYRAQWLSTMRANPSKSKNEIRKIASREFIWLYRNDRQWLDQNSPKLLRRDKYGGDNRVDWIKRDKDLAEEISCAAKKLLMSIQKPIRVTQYTLGKLIGKTGLVQNNLEKLPRTKYTISLYTETVEDFQIRRVKYVAEQLRLNGEKMNRSSIIRIAGLGVSFSEEVNNEVINQLNQ
ncbi:TnsD family Tn7-like transposition protein [Paenibacillus odorifer]|uniref:TnsD family Tn7-like transposition protein n=1 Tax=Paenibacillus TaxID=44249 RepID=UPI00096C078D|nr:TnsD family Tn7-like transposition protein [Paenibacillus odorifer]OME29232.1 hypothetical protein BSK63_22225 [Paenibacillus odorifer]OME34884.1 hypothetical protein BSK46_20260 [Paenibacillus odorifer]